MTAPPSAHARREGIGRALYEAAVVEITMRKAVRIEVTSEITVRNANAFSRALGFEQASYRFVAGT
jgi:ribosomal protein S18 acetylase RimI-like enzyme